MTSGTVQIDGSQGEGGGQILRTSLSLSAITGRPCVLNHIRARRARPGLARQHLTAVHAAQRICCAEVHGDKLDSQTLTFTPGPVVPGKYVFDIGTAGSTTLVLQTVLPILLQAAEPSHVEIRGGTHNPLAPPVEFLQQAFCPMLQRMGVQLEVQLLAPGFYPRGGGRISVAISPATSWRRLKLPAAPAPRAISATAVLAKLPRHIAERELEILARRFKLRPNQLHVTEFPNTASPGNVLYLECQADDIIEVFSNCGKKGVTAENVAKQLVAEAEAYLNAGAPVGPHLADQLLIPMALAGGGAFETCELTPHATSNMDVIAQFLPVEFQVEDLPQGTKRVRVERLAG